MNSHVFTEERGVILHPVRKLWKSLLRDQEEYQHLLRASEVMLNAEEPSIRTYFCAKSIVLDYLSHHPTDPRAFKELGKVHLFSCGGEETLRLAQEAFEQSQALSGETDPETWFLIATCHRIRLADAPSKFGNQAKSTSRSRMICQAERALKLAVRYSHPTTHVYRFALSDFYLSLKQFSNALNTLIAGLSASGDMIPDAKVYHQLGKYGIHCVDALCAKGSQTRAHKFARRAMYYFERALDIHPASDDEWLKDFESARRWVDRLSNFNPHDQSSSNPISKSMKTNTDPSSLPSLVLPVYRNHQPTSSIHSTSSGIDLINLEEERLLKFLRDSENHAGTYTPDDEILSNLANLPETDDSNEYIESKLVDAEHDRKRGGCHLSGQSRYQRDGYLSHLHVQSACLARVNRDTKVESQLNATPLPQLDSMSDSSSNEQPVRSRTPSPICSNNPLPHSPHVAVNDQRHDSSPSLSAVYSLLDSSEQVNQNGDARDRPRHPIRSRNSVSSLSSEEAGLFELDSQTVKPK